MKSRSISFFIIVLIFFCGCNSGNEIKDYQKSVNDWHKKRIDRLATKSGWLSIAGLFWLEQGENSFGSDSSNSIIFPKKAPKSIGSIFLNDTTVTIKVNDNIEVFADSNRVISMALKNDNQKGTTLLNMASFSWYIIKRSGRYGIRLKDSAHPNIKAFTGVDRFPVDKLWRIKATLEVYDSTKTISIPDVLGNSNDMPCPGALVFEINGQTLKLDAIASKKDKKYWLIFADETSGEETYGAGRFLYADKIDSTGTTYIDFNKAYNPPCVFTPFATCPLPPLQNRLTARIEAGEKNWEGVSH